MNSSFSRRGRIRAVSFFAAVLVLSIGTAVSQHIQRVQLQRAVTNSYLHAFSEVTASLDKMDAALQKGVYVTTSPMLCSLGAHSLGTSAPNSGGTILAEDPRRWGLGQEGGTLLRDQPESLLLFLCSRRGRSEAK